MFSFKDYLIEKKNGNLKDACWSGYEAIGMKNKNGKKVPNCVPVKEDLDLKQDAPSVESIAKKHDVSVEEIQKQLEIGMKIEAEHGKNPGTEREIALDHLNEKPDYYTRLKKVEEATYQGREVPLNKPMAGDVKKSKVFVDPDGDGKAKKVNFGDKNMRIKKNIPARRKSFRARHHCEDPGPKDKARYWSCKAW